MAQFINFLLIFLSAFVSLIQAQAQGKASPSPSPSPKPPPACLIKDIRGMDVSKCTCEPHHKDTCHKDGCTACRGAADIQFRFTKSVNCHPGCTDDDKECTGCGLWFSTLCTCLRYDDCNKTASYSNPPKDQAIFVLTNSDERLVTTTDLLPGILEMANNPPRYEVGWKFAQGNFDPKTQALVLNSVRSRTHEQLHIHVCDKPEPADPRVLAILDNIPKKDHNLGRQLKQVANHEDLYCRTIEAGSKDMNVYDFVAAIKEVLDNQSLDVDGKICHGFAGAAIIRDNHLNIWACVSGNRDGPLSRFCKKQKSP
ncbi:hypothetical protein GGI35DRAFT_434960 [Trichoderma velutinum]